MVDAAPTTVRLPMTSRPSVAPWSFEAGAAEPTWILVHRRWLAVGAAAFFTCALAVVALAPVGARRAHGVGGASRAARTAAVVATPQLTIEPPATAPTKVIELDDTDTDAKPAAHLRRSGFRHLGSDRVSRRP
jgi:hypothetical protein